MSSEQRHTDAAQPASVAEFEVEPPVNSVPGTSGVHGRSGENGLELHLANICKSYAGVRALDDVSCHLRGGEVHALCGHNGAGKSTLVKVLSGLAVPDTGEIVFNGETHASLTPREAQQLGIALVEQEGGLVAALSIAENLVLGDVTAGVLVRRRAMIADAAALLKRVGCEHLDPRTRVEDLSAGDRKLAEIARALGRSGRVLILDEPTAALSYTEARRVFQVVRGLAQHGAAVVFVSHRLDEVFELCDQITVLRDGQKVRSAPAAQLDRAQLVDLMVGEAEQHEQPVRREVERSGPALCIRGLSVPPQVPAFDLEIEGGSIVGLAGQIGSGASDMLRALGGLRPSIGGSVEIDGRRASLRTPLTAARAGLRYVTYDRKNEGLFLDQTVATNITATRLRSLSRYGWLGRAARNKLAQRLVTLASVRTKSLRTRVRTLSGGNQQKVLIGRCLEGAKNDTFLLDDPTQGVDVVGRAEIHNLIREACERGNTVLLASTELSELLDLADVIVTIYDGRIVSSMTKDEASPTRVLAEITHTRSSEITLEPSA